MKANIHIVTHWTAEGGSTESLIGLTNMFNQRGLEAVLYGPHRYHLDKCSGRLLGNDIPLKKNDVLICHLMEMDRRPDCRKVILSCHEKHFFPVRQKNVSGYDVVQFLSHHQKSWHQYSGESIIIPPNIPAIQLVTDGQDTRDVAAVVGTIFPPKRTHKSIKRALRDGMRKVIIFGNIGDQNYFNSRIKPLLSDKVIYKGQVQNPQDIYNAVSCVYQSSESETYGRVKAECKLAGVEYRGTPECDIDINIFSDDELFLLWGDLLGI